MTAPDSDIDALLEAAFRGNFAKLYSLLDADRSLVWEARGDVTALHLAASAGQEDAAHLLLSKGAALDASGSEGTALFQATWAQRESLVDLLLLNGADVNLATTSGVTALMTASFNGNTVLARRLLDADADVDAPTSEGACHFYSVPVPVCGESALHLAAAGGHVEVIRLLLDRGAAANLADQLGQTAAHWAARHQQEEALALLRAAQD